MIRRRKPIKRSQKPLSKFSKKRRLLNLQYGSQARLFKAAWPTCHAKIKDVCTQHTQDVHHVFGRGKYLLVSSTWLAVCRNCHQWIHEHPGQARTLNLLK